MSTSFSSIGISRMRRRRGLVALIYVIGLAIAGFVGTAVFKLLGTGIGSSGFSQHLTERFDLVLWFDFWKGIGPGLAGVARQAVVAGLIMMVWKVASQVGLIHALHGDGESGFWQGVSRYTRRGLGLGLLYLVPLLVLLIAIFAGFIALAKSMGEVGQFWTWVVFVPLLVIGATATFDLFNDYARMHLVLRGSTVGRSWLEGIKWPFQHFRSILLYKLWFLLSAALWVAVGAVGFYLPDHSVGAVLLAFLVQQILILARTGASVSWTGAEVAFFEEMAPPIVALDTEEIASADSDSPSLDYDPGVEAG